MQVGDLITYKPGLTIGLATRWGVGIIVSFDKQTSPAETLWIKVYWGKWLTTSRGPVNDFIGVSSENKCRR
jgi:hypothetical protein